MRGNSPYLLSVLLTLLSTISIHAENSETQSLTLFVQRACEESLTIQPQNDSNMSLSFPNESSIEDIARKLLAGLSQQLDQKPEILAREINALVEGTLIFKSGLVAHLVNLELSRQFSFKSNDLAKSRLKIEAFASLSHEKKWRSHLEPANAY
jgi:hypothetical protein